MHDLIKYFLLIYFTFGFSSVFQESVGVKLGEFFLSFFEKENKEKEFANFILINLLFLQFNVCFSFSTIHIGVFEGRLIIIWL